MTDDHDHTEHVEETEIGYRAEIKSTRGTGTRDQDKVALEAHTETIQQLKDELPAMHAMVRQTMDNQRAHNPDEEQHDE